MRFSRRALLAAAALVPFARAAWANAPLGEVVEASGEGTLERGTEVIPLVSGLALEEGDSALTVKNGLALLLLAPDTRVNLGAETTIQLAALAPGGDGRVAFAGAMLFDRPEGTGGPELTFVTEAGEVALMGTKLFIGPSRGTFAVFVERGAVAVTGGGVTRTLAAGDGVDMVAGGAPTEVAQWGAERIAEAYASVGVTG